jgi:hypothetical protein
MTSANPRDRVRCSHCGYYVQVEVYLAHAKDCAKRNHLLREQYATEEKLRKF